MIRWLKKNLLTVIMLCGLAAGAGLLLYPSVANYWNSFHQTRAIMQYADEVAAMDAEDYETILNNAKDYNRRLGENGINWNMTEAQKADYMNQLVIGTTGIMGYISIPKIHVKLPIYHGTEESVLQTSIGHLEQTSLPVGGESSHCCLSGHRGLPSARLFTDLDKLKEGDTWTVTVLNETRTYQADQIRIVEPADLQNLMIEKGEDFETLITCTPYGINTHRMLVRGHRVANGDGDANLTADAIQIEPIYIAPFLAAPILVLLLIMVLVTTRRARKFDTDAQVRAYLRMRGLR